jgi:flagellar motor protein MotB
MIRHATLAAVLLVAGVGCESQMHEENVALHRQNRELQDKLDSANALLRASPDPAQYRAMQAELLDRDRQITDLRNQPPPPGPTTAPAAGPGLAAGLAVPSPFGDLETHVDARAGTVTVTLPGDVLFAPGRADLQPAARTSLEKVASVLQRNYAGRPLRIEGHTDADPIKRSAQDWTDNLDLSLGRAAAVSRYLEANGVDPKRVTTSGFGSFRPRGTDKKRNRRVDIVVVTR